MGTLFGLFNDVGAFFRSLRRAMQLGTRTVDAACDEAEARLQLTAPQAEQVASMPALPLHDDPTDPDANVPRTRRVDFGKNGQSHARKVKSKP